MRPIQDQHLGLVQMHQLGDDQLGKHCRRDIAAEKMLEPAIVTFLFGAARQTTGKILHIDRTNLDSAHATRLMRSIRWRVRETVPCIRAFRIVYTSMVQLLDRGFIAISADYK